MLEIKVYLNGLEIQKYTIIKDQISKKACRKSASEFESYKEEYFIKNSVDIEFRLSMIDWVIENERILLNNEQYDN